MTLDALLFSALVVAAPALWIVSGILIWGALQKPYIQFLTVTAAATTLIALGISVYVFAVINAGLGYPFNQEGVRILFRAVLLGIAVYPLWWLYLFRSGKFADQ